MTRTHLPYNEIAAVLFMVYSQYPDALFSCIPNVGQTVIRNFNCLLTDKEEITLAMLARP